jgi:hypothetical protein
LTRTLGNATIMNINQMAVRIHIVCGGRGVGAIWARRP